MNSTLKTSLQVLLFILILAGTYFLGNLVPRIDFQSTFGVYLVLFGSMILIYLFSDEKTPWFWIFLAGILLRFSLFLSIPIWSDDFARFLWDGELLRLNENPYSETPGQWKQNHPLETTELQKNLFGYLNSPEYFSIYPPLNQAVFWLAAKSGQGTIWNGVLGLRLLMILGEIGVFFMFLKVFKIFEIPINKLWLYWINPLIVIEITGNLHFEGLVLLLLLASIFHQGIKKSLLSGVFWGLSVGVKLVPLMLFPAWIAFPKTQKNLIFWIGAGIAVGLSFTPLLIDSSWFNFFQSLKLYQGKFEFNASIYYLLREVGFWIHSYNTIAELTKILSALTLIGILYLSWKKKPQTLPELAELWVLIYLIYLILQPVVHPWYLIPGFGLSLLTNKKAFLVWTFTVIFSYQAYGNEVFEENPLFLLAEYAVLFQVILVDYSLLKRKTNLSQ